jgi:hypothetical protein
MPRQAGMTPGKTAAVLNYIMTEFNNVEAGADNLYSLEDIAKIISNNGRLSSQKVYDKRSLAFTD